MTGEETVDQTYVIANEDAESQAHQAGRGDQTAIEPRKSFARKGKRKRDGNGNEHHACDGAHAENKQIKNGPAGVANGAEDEKGDGGGTSEAMDNADEERA